MKIGAGITVADRKLTVLGKTVLMDVDDNILVTPDSGSTLVNGAFLGVVSDQMDSRRVFPVGKLQGLRFVCVFSLQNVVDDTEDGHLWARDDESAIYTVFLPILEGEFRAVLQGNGGNELEICLESGDPAVDEFEGSHLVFVGAGLKPFDVITNAVKTLERHLQTFSHHEKNKMPDMLNWFGWCTWDAFYTDVSSNGLKQGLESLEKGEVAPKFVIIDDG